MMRTARRYHRRGYLLPHRKFFRHRARLSDFNQAGLSPPAKTVKTANEPPAPVFPLRESRSVEIPPIDHGFGTLAARHPANQATRPSEELVLLPLAGISGVTFKGDYRPRRRLGIGEATRQVHTAADRYAS